MAIQEQRCGDFPLKYEADTPLAFLRAGGFFVRKVE
jgi:hypothetical protein